MKTKKSKNTIAKKIVDKVIYELVYLKDIKPENSLADDLGIDSLRLIEFIVALESELNIEIDSVDLNPENLNTVNDVYCLAEKYMRG